jgi:hypothetical protein
LVHAIALLVGFHGISFGCEQSIPLGQRANLFAYVKRDGATQKCYGYHRVMRAQNRAQHQRTDSAKLYRVSDRCFARAHVLAPRMNFVWITSVSFFSSRLNLRQSLFRHHRL